MNKQQLANKIWESANKMRSKIEANEYKDYILGFIFYKYLSDKEVKFLKSKGYTDASLPTVTDEDPRLVKWVQQNLGYFIAYKDLFSTWLNMGRDFDSSNVTDALAAFSRLISDTHKNVFEKVFDTLQTGLTKLGDTSGARTKAISELLQLIKDIPMDGKQDYDVLGFIYEYLISMFAANAGKKAGEFYTPHEVALLMSEIVAYHLQDREEIRIYDPTSGSGSLLINIGRCVAKHMLDSNRIKYYAQELKENTYNLTRMNLVMRGILPDNIVTRNGDTLEDDWPYFDDNDPVNTYNPLYVDAVVSNPPYSQAWDPTNKESDPRYARFGLAPKGKADYAFLLHDLFHIKPDGIMCIVLPHGVLFRGGEEGTIRKNLIENNHIDAIIGLPANIFFGTGIPTIIMVLRQKRDRTNTLIIDASKGFMKEGKNNKLRASDIKRIVDAYIARTDIPKFARVVTREEIRANDYNLNIPRYVDSSEAAETWDIFASMFGGIPTSEIDAMGDYWEAFPELRKALFTASETPYVSVASDDLKKAIFEHPEVVRFRSHFADAFSDFEEYCHRELIDSMESVSVGQEETIINDDIFRRLANIPLVDRYGAYQILDDAWRGISGDLEMIQTEGTSAITKVDPNLVIKKKDGKDEEVQDGYVGHILPFDLIQKTILSESLTALRSMENRLSEISSAYEEILDSLSEDEKDGDILNEEKDSFVPAAIAKEAKRIRSEMKRGTSFDEDSLESKVLRVDALLTEEKSIKAQVKKASAELQLKTKETIESLSADQAYALLHQKWISPIKNSLMALPDSILNQLVGKIQELVNKYAVTFAAVEDEIAETEKELSAMIDDLTGNDYDLAGLRELKALLGGE